jgi:sodium transport system ATP-binding protein
MIEVIELVKHFGKIKAVDGLDFTAQDGQVLGLLGANGAGKTTTMRLVSAVIRPTSGDIRVGGIDTQKQPDLVRQMLGTLPENWGLYPRFTPREHFEMFGRYYNMGGIPLKQRIEEVIELLGIQDYADRRCEPFSKGMKQKVAIGRAILHNPTHLLLDEPTNGLDVMSARQVRALITRMRELGHCVIISTHVLSEAERLCDDVVIMDAGKVKAHGSVQAMRDQTGADTLEEAFLRLVGHADVEVV